ncbi:MAG: hypothetical protein AAF610_13965 [Pseudomonadota bacterium]
MSKLLEDKRVVAALAVLACIVVYFRVVAPIVSGGGGASAADMADPMASDDIGDPMMMTAMDDDPSLAGSTSARRSSRAPLAGGTGAPQETLARAQRDLSNLDIGALVFNENPARDPFTPPREVVETAAPKPAPKRTVVQKVVSAPLPTLTAIAFADNHRAAVLDNQIAREGDVLENFSVAQISREYVVLKGRTTRNSFTLKLNP